MRGFSRSFLLLWLAVPIGTLFIILFSGLSDLDILVSVTFVSLFLAGMVLPLELSRFEKVDSKLGVSLWILLAPAFLAAGRLSAAGWKAAAEFLLVGAWIGIGSAVWILASRRKKNPILVYLFGFSLLGFVAPFLAYLQRDFGGGNSALLSSLSPFTLALQFSRGEGFETSAYISAGLFALFGFAARREAVS